MSCDAGLPQPLTFIAALEEQLNERKEQGEEILVAERSFVEYCVACNAALLQFVAAYWTELHPSLDIQRRPPFCDAAFADIRERYANSLAENHEDVYAQAMEQLRARGDVQIASALSGWFDFVKPFVLTACAHQEPHRQPQEDPIDSLLETLSTSSDHPPVTPRQAQQGPSTPSASSALPTRPTNATSPTTAGPGSPITLDPLGIPPPDVLRFTFSPFISMANVVHDYLEASPCLRDIEATYGPGVRKKQSGPGQHWRSKEYQSADRQKKLCKECSRRKSIHEVLDAAWPDNVTSKVDELNTMMVNHFGLASFESVMYDHMAWLARELSKARVTANGATFDKRSDQAAKHAAARQTAKRLRLT